MIFERETALRAGVRLQGTGLVTNVRARRSGDALRGDYADARAPGGGGMTDERVTVYSPRFSVPGAIIETGLGTMLNQLPRAGRTEAPQRLVLRP